MRQFCSIKFWRCNVINSWQTGFCTLNVKIKIQEYITFWPEIRNFPASVRWTEERREFPSGANSRGIREVLEGDRPSHYRIRPTYRIDRLPSYYRICVFWPVVHACTKCIGDMKYKQGCSARTKLALCIRGREPRKFGATCHYAGNTIVPWPT